MLRSRRRRLVGIGPRRAFARRRSRRCWGAGRGGAVFDSYRGIVLGTLFGRSASESSFPEVRPRCRTSAPPRRSWSLSGGPCASPSPLYRKIKLFSTIHKRYVKPLSIGATSRGGGRGGPWLSSEVAWTGIDEIPGEKRRPAEDRAPERG